MKKKLLFTIILLLIPTTAFAASVSVTLSCPAKANASSVVSCTVEATPSGSDLRGLQANYSITNGTYSAFDLANGWTSYSSSATGFSVGKNEATTSKATVGTLKITMPASGSMTVGLTGVVGSSSSYVDFDGNTPTATIRVTSNVNTLSALSVSNGSLSPNFSSSTTSYTATIDAATTTISATKTDDNATMTGTGTKNLEYGSNTFTVIVTSESGNSKTYTIVITRPDGRSSNNNLKTLSLSSGGLTFNKNTTSYDVTVEADISKVTVRATTEDGKATFVNGPREVDLDYGLNTIIVKVKAENGSEKTYTIKVTRKDSRSSDNTLSSLTVSAGTLKFNKDTLEYKMTVPFETDKIDVTYKSNNDKATVTITGNENLIVGDNTITITVKAENGSEKVYKIVVTKQKEGEKVLSNDSNLSSLTIKGYKIDFTKNKTDYVLKLKKGVTKLDIKVSTSDKNATYEIKGNENLTEGSVIKIIVTAEDKSSTEYTITIKEKSSNLIFIIIISILSLIVIGETIYIILMKINKLPKKESKIKNKLKEEVKEEIVIEEDPDIIIKKDITLDD